VVIGTVAIIVYLLLVTVGFVATEEAVDLAAPSA
jgi:hypothetical protein